MEVVKYNEYIRVEVSQYGCIDEAISQIKRHVDGIDYVGAEYDSCSYLVDGKEYSRRAEAILAELKFNENFPEETLLINEDCRYDYMIVCSRIENDTIRTPRTNRTRYGDQNVYEIIEILYNQPYITELPKNMSEKLKLAFIKLSEEIIKNKNNK
jgi:hypothetical protein